MSDEPYQDSVLVRIRRDIAESEKFMAEQRKLIAEAQKLGVERWTAPIIAIGGIVIGALGLIVALFRH